MPDSLGCFAPPVGASDMEYTAWYLLALHYLRVQPKNPYMASVQRELKTNARIYVDNMVRDLIDMRTSLAGLKYERRDVRDVLTEMKAIEGNTLFYMTPPSGSRVYTKSYEDPATLLGWKPEPIKELGPNELSETFDGMTNVPSLMCIWTSYPDRFSDKWHKVFAEVRGKRTSYVLTNRDLDDRFIQNTVKKVPTAPYEIYQEQEIRPDSKISFELIKANEAEYYRDLFVHGLGLTVADLNGVMLIDGRVTTVWGLAVRDVYLGKVEYIYEVYGISKTCERYMRIGKLFMLMLTSVDFRDWILSKYIILEMREPKGIRTSSPTKRHEGKTDRGVMKLIKREEKNGGFLLQYETEWNGKHWGELLSDWLEKWKEKSRG
jgi:hypothetical protein